MKPQKGSGQTAVRNMNKTETINQRLHRLQL